MSNAMYQEFIEQIRPFVPKEYLNTFNLKEDYTSLMNGQLTPKLKTLFGKIIIYIFIDIDVDSLTFYPSNRGYCEIKGGGANDVSLHVVIDLEKLKYKFRYVSNQMIKKKGYSSALRTLETRISIIDLVSIRDIIKERGLQNLEYLRTL